MDLRIAANAVAATLAEVGKAPEGILYAGLMTKGGSLEEFHAVKTWLLVAGLAVEAAGPVLIATPRLVAVYKKAMEGKSNVLARDQAG
jgi:uncharacterized membrane protein YhhN